MRVHYVLTSEKNAAFMERYSKSNGKSKTRKRKKSSSAAKPPVALPRLGCGVV